MITHSTRPYSSSGKASVAWIRSMVNCGTVTVLDSFNQWYGRLFIESVMDCPAEETNIPDLKIAEDFPLNHSLADNNNLLLISGNNRAICEGRVLDHRKERRRLNPFQTRHRCKKARRNTPGFIVMEKRLLIRF